MASVDKFEAWALLAKVNGSWKILAIRDSYERCFEIMNKCSKFDIKNKSLSLRIALIREVDDFAAKSILKFEELFSQE